MKTYKCVALNCLLIISSLSAFAQAVDRAREKAEQIKCASNLREIGLAFRIWENSHGNQFPFNVPESFGGTLESCTNGIDGFDNNSWKHLRSLSVELKTPRMLLCPSDSSKRVAYTFKMLAPNNVTYQIRSGKDVSSTHPAEILGRCPVHNIQVLCDGSVPRQLDK